MDFDLRESTRLEREFDKFDAANPHVYRLLLRFAREWEAKHPGRPCSLSLLYDRARWEVAMTTDSVDTFKLNDHHTAYYARKIAREFPDLGKMFTFRKVTKASS